MSFLKDLEDGKRAEALVIGLLARAGIPSARNTTEDLTGHDLRLASGHLAEVKFDKMAAKTGNLAIEFANSRTGKESGLAATRSSLWIHVVPKPFSVYVGRTADLRQFVADEKPLRVVRGAGDGNADLYLYRMDAILPKVFYGLDVTDPEHLQSLLEFLHADPHPPSVGLAQKRHGPDPGQEPR